MKQFKKVIQVEVAVDTIAQMLLSKFSPEEKHREMIVETIIGNTMNDNRILSDVYNSLNGYTNEISFREEEIIKCNLETYMYAPDEKSEEVPTPFIQQHVKIGEAKILEVDLYRRDKLKIEYHETQKDGSFSLRAKWVSHLECDKVKAVELQS